MPLKGRQSRPKEIQLAAKPLVLTTQRFRFRYVALVPHAAHWTALRPAGQGGSRLLQDPLLALDHGCAVLLRDAPGLLQVVHAGAQAAARAGSRQRPLGIMSRSPWAVGRAAG